MKKALFPLLIIIISITAFFIYKIIDNNKPIFKEKVIVSPIDSSEQTQLCDTCNGLLKHDTENIIYYSDILKHEFDLYEIFWLREVRKYQNDGKLAYASYNGIAREQEKPYIRIIVNENESVFDIHGPWINYTEIYSSQKRPNSYETITDEGKQIYNKHIGTVFEANDNNAPEDAQEILQEKYFSQKFITEDWNYMIRMFNNIDIYFSYEGYVYMEEPIFFNYIDLWFKHKKSNFPLKVDKNWLIINESLYDFVYSTNAQVGSYILMFINELTKEQYEDYDDESPTVTVGIITGKLDKIVKSKRQVYITGLYYLPNNE